MTGLAVRAIPVVYQPSQSSPKASTTAQVASVSGVNYVPKTKIAPRIAAVAVSAAALDAVVGAGAQVASVSGANYIPKTKIGPHAGLAAASATAQPGVVGVNSIDRIVYSMADLDEATPHGVPSWYSWGKGPVLDHATPPAGMGAITIWGQIYCDPTNSHPANTRVEVRHLECYLWSISGNTWIRVQHQVNTDGAHYVEDFSTNSSIAADLRTESDGGTSTTMVDGYNFHFYPFSRGVVSNPSDIAAVYTTYEARLILDDPNGADNRNSAHWVANTGADWWRDTSIGFGDGSNNPDVGQARFTYLTNDWSAINFYTGGPVVAGATGAWTEAQLRASLPPVNAMD